MRLEFVLFSLGHTVLIHFNDEWYLSESLRVTCTIVLLTCWTRSSRAQRAFKQLMTSCLGLVFFTQLNDLKSELQGKDKRSQTWKALSIRQWLNPRLAENVREAHLEPFCLHLGGNWIGQAILLNTVHGHHSKLCVSIDTDIISVKFQYVFFFPNGVNKEIVEEKSDIDIWGQKTAIYRDLWTGIKSAPVLSSPVHWRSKPGLAPLISVRWSQRKIIKTQHRTHLNDTERLLSHDKWLSLPR